jgi:hypothetical protein
LYREDEKGKVDLGLPSLYIRAEGATAGYLSPGNSPN